MRLRCCFVVLSAALALAGCVKPRLPFVAADLSPKARRNMRYRSFATLLLFGIASVVAFKYPYAGLAICCACLIVYLRPDAPE